MCALKKMIIQNSPFVSFREPPKSWLQSWLLPPDIGQPGRKGLAHFSRNQGIRKLHGGSQGTKALVYGTALQERLSRFLSSCEVVSRGILYKAGWLLTADMFSFELWEKEKKSPPWNVELGKDSRCLKCKSPSYIRWFRTFWKLLEKCKYFPTKFALSHLRSFSSKSLNFFLPGPWQLD